MGESTLKKLTNIETGLECETGECVCVCVHALDWKCVCEHAKVHLQTASWLAGWRAQVENSQEKTEHTSSYMYLLYVDVSYPPANPDA